jgi:hypothetical protein
VATDTASAFSITGSDQLSLQQADAGATETETTTATVTEGADVVVGFTRDGADVVFEVGDTAEAETFATVTTPTAGTSPEYKVGVSVDSTSGPYQGAILAGIKVDRAITTGQFAHIKRALTELIA